MFDQYQFDGQQFDGTASTSLEFSVVSSDADLRNLFDLPLFDQITWDGESDFLLALISTGVRFGNGSRAGQSTP